MQSGWKTSDLMNTYTAEVALAQLVARKLEVIAAITLYERPECDDLVGTQVGYETDV